MASRNSYGGGAIEAAFRFQLERREQEGFVFWKLRSQVARIIGSRAGGSVWWLEMLENWVFMVGLLLVSFLFAFHGIVLLIAPDKYLPTYEWGRPAKIELLRKRPLDLRKRFAGLCLAAVIVWVFMLPTITWMLHPKPGTISGGESPLPRGMARWDLLAVGIFAVVSGCYLMVRPEGSIRLMFSANLKKLEEKSTLKLWTIYIQVAALFFLLWSLLPLNKFIKSLR